jgi:hypothetical protein
LPGEVAPLSTFGRLVELDGAIDVWVYLLYGDR